jgi:hypothetical protein
MKLSYCSGWQDLHAADPTYPGVGPAAPAGRKGWHGKRRASNAMRIDATDRFFEFKKIVFIFKPHAGPPPGAYDLFI